MALLGKKKVEGQGSAKISKALGGLASLKAELNEGKKLNNIEINAKQVEVDALVAKMDALKASNDEATECCANIEAIQPKAKESK